MLHEAVYFLTYTNHLLAYLLFASPHLAVLLQKKFNKKCNAIRGVFIYDGLFERFSPLADAL